MLTNNIQNHPGLRYAEDLKAICKPLQILNITYFSHVVVDPHGKFCGISNNANFHEHYLKNACYNADIHLAGLDLGKMVMWDAMPLVGQSALLYQASISFGANHTFTIIEEDDKGKHYYHFASNTPYTSINQVYLNHLDLLHLFIQNFKETAYNSKALNKTYQMKFSIDNETNGYSLANNDTALIESRSQFLKELNLNKSNTKSSITLRELEILKWLHLGKSCVEIAEILNIAQITVHKHIYNIKEKTQCYSFFQLGEFFNQTKAFLKD